MNNETKTTTEYPSCVLPSPEGLASFLQRAREMHQPCHEGGQGCQHKPQLDELRKLIEAEPDFEKLRVLAGLLADYPEARQVARDVERVYVFWWGLMLGQEQGRALGRKEVAARATRSAQRARASRG